MSYPINPLGFHWAPSVLIHNVGDPLPLLAYMIRNCSRQAHQQLISCPISNEAIVLFQEPASTKLYPFL